MTKHALNQDWLMKPCLTASAAAGLAAGSGCSSVKKNDSAMLVWLLGMLLRRWSKEAGQVLPAETEYSAACKPYHLGKEALLACQQPCWIGLPHVLLDCGKLIEVAYARHSCDSISGM